MIRPAQREDLGAVLTVYGTARKFMRENGNPMQWGDSYPSEELLKDDIAKRRLYVVEEGGAIHGAFAFCPGLEPTYAHLEQGSWKADGPYATIHRVASDGAVKGIFARCADFCKERCANLRIDTHRNNKIMRHLIEKNGFEKCGVIHVRDGSPRIAYQYTKT